MRAHRSAFGFEPADLAKGRLGFRIRHPQYVDKTEGLGFAGEEEVLAHEGLSVISRCHMWTYRAIVKP
jgi:hypothetical protein